MIYKRLPIRKPLFFLPCGMMVFDCTSYVGNRKFAAVIQGKFPAVVSKHLVYFTFDKFYICLCNPLLVRLE